MDTASLLANMVFVKSAMTPAKTFQAIQGWGTTWQLHVAS